MNAAPTAQPISDFLQLLFAPGDVFEVRAPKCRAGGSSRLFTTAGYFSYDAIEVAAREIAGLDDSAIAPGVYVTLNPVQPDLLARANCRLCPLSTTTADDQVQCRRWLLIDCDPCRPSGMSSTDAELRLAEGRSRAITDHLRTLGWPEPLVIMSGNGYHLLLRIDLPAQDDGLVERVLKSLAAKFDDAQVKIDTVVHNAARITKVAGTMARKGDAFKGGNGAAARPHRRAHLVSAPAERRAALRERLEALAASGPQPAISLAPSRSVARHFDCFEHTGRGVASYLERHGVSIKGQSHKDSAAFLYLDRCPVVGGCESENDSDLAVIVSDTGQISYKNLHNRGAGLEWLDVREALEPGYKAHATRSATIQNQPVVRERPDIRSAHQLIQSCPALRQAIIEGLLRRGETMNVVASSKQGKSWLVQSLAVAVAMGRDWLGFKVTRGRALLVDVELHDETLAFRLTKCFQAEGVDPRIVGDAFGTLSLRGRSITLDQLKEQLLALNPGEFDVVILDPLYRLLPKDGDENSNATMTALYNALDEIARHLNAAMVIVHHTSKGLQSKKSVTDIGAGGGAQSRAPDTHLVLREHSVPDAVVVDAVVRSWPPISPFVIRRTDGRWTRDDSLDPTELAKPGGSRKQAANAKPAGAKTNAVMTVEEFVKRFVNGAPVIKEEIFVRAKANGVSNTQAEGLLKLAEARKLVRRHEHQTQAHQFSALLGEEGGGARATHHPQSTQALGGCGGGSHPPSPPSQTSRKKRVSTSQRPTRKSA